MNCPFHGDAHLSACGYCRRAKNRAVAETRRKDRAWRRAHPNRPPPTEEVYIDRPERSTAEDVVAILRAMMKEFGGRA